jgi:hypothetical protein
MSSAFERWCKGGGACSSLFPHAQVHVSDQSDDDNLEPQQHKLNNMKVATLQLDSKIRNVEHNIATANSILSSSPPPADLDLLVLPELAFTGYNYPSFDSIKPYLEPTTAGVTTQWAISTAKRLGCHVIAGYPEISTDNDATRNKSTNDGSIEPNIQAIQLHRHRQPNRRNPGQLPQVFPLLHRRKLGRRRTDRILLRHSRFAG